MIDLLINVSEIYGQPHANNGHSNPDGEGEDTHENGGNLSDEDDDDDDLDDDADSPAQRNWNLATDPDDYDDGQNQLNGLRSHSFANSECCEKFVEISINAEFSPSSIGHDTDHRNNE